MRSPLFLILLLLLAGFLIWYMVGALGLRARQPQVPTEKDERYYGRVLGLRGEVTREEVRRRYRELVAQYHPDKVNHLGPKLREMAELEMKQINEAFEYFKRRWDL